MALSAAAWVMTASSEKVDPPPRYPENFAPINPLHSTHPTLFQRFQRLTSLEFANADCPCFLIHDSACEDIEGWLEQCYQYLFEEVLEQWYVDEALWPQDRTLELFKAWCDVEIHGVIIDLVDHPLLDTDYEEY